MSVIFHIFHKNKGNRRAIDRIFRENMANLSHFYPSYLSSKGLSIKDGLTALLASMNPGISHERKLYPYNHGLA